MLKDTSEELWGIAKNAREGRISLDELADWADGVREPIEEFLINTAQREASRTRGS